MAATNEITGDSLQSKVTTDAYRDGYDRIFGKKEKVSDERTATGNQHDADAVDGHQPVPAA